MSEKMGLSLKTISVTGQNITEKLGVQRQADLTRLAVKDKIIDRPPSLTSSRRSTGVGCSYEKILFK